MRLAMRVIRVNEVGVPAQGHNSRPSLHLEESTHRFGCTPND
jgi:hypothetical protein